ncbi:hypothetical protein [Paracoccus ravus]|uniref:hypothetical protein n=1 Tax=Paracoccus ravus TaxID=2447760 RepID=UPI00106E7D55|nr:hypothetical protein [Paracoccus ravus]
MTADTFRIPMDVAEHCLKAAKALTGHAARLDYLHTLWADEDPDPKNGAFWHVQIAHPEAAKLRDNLDQIATFMKWLAEFSETDEEASE